MPMRDAWASARCADCETRRKRHWFAFARERRRVPRIGEILVRRGLVTRRALAEALLEQPGTGLLIGELLVQRGAIRRADLQAALREQKFRRILVFIMALGGAVPTGVAGSLLGSGGTIAVATGAAYIGTVLEGGSAEIVGADGLRRSGAPGSKIRFGDRISATGQSKVRVILNDRTLLTVQSNATVVADDFVFDRRSSLRQRAEFRVVGGFRLVGNLLSRPVEHLAGTGTIGIRG